ncbi:phenylacetate-coenzyme A ligase PaaK-like adenylate-forming protein [Dysgonomonas sp. PFB1-18]|uniref:GH3 auxin-responsive promoter family protein n=1 Tax=unclassified Dysgonomonas TaxID=2630389 RepID=UPI0024745C6E|nr:MULTISPECIES: GH3 auxin-responsive promoter family protein [unclassified Dysgonomonas]MDH6308262.1 phenylacetate-coenzyme A ligase PaaK-like adenylate-forming protein [Dysgonomonas sp. PF1-14]MDH6338299.1 phenylacetate-coenzyme A ligase PaaK-like adenylate-forming protein [Dysgonomonas sp. PF1-16]MDH6379796.1 phenylacetate-coenzyme A ligase PaaK-like adenylate-forming protein [Dysgonomonas sp. PFB1-18]MDH6397114.1 phenylacetate-coenzyme A ligase PaaK-like adenylate-forming protein [Dysgonomo
MIAGIAHKYLDFKYREVARFIENPVDTQEKILSYLLGNGSQTFIGQQYRFSELRNKDDYRKKVPVFHYEDLRPYLDKILVDKQSNVLWNKPVEWFAMSSGTTEDKSKYIPVTKESLTGGHYKCGEQMLAIYGQANHKAKFFFGKTLVLGGSKQINNIGGGVFTGDISAILIKNLYFWAKRSRTPESISLLPDWEEKLQALTDYAVRNDVRAFMGVPSWLLVLLKKIKTDTGRELTDIWPNLEVFFHGGVSFTPFEEQYRKIIQKPDMYYWETYNASEGFFGVQYTNGSKDMLLMLDSGIYYEFVPMSEWDKENPQTLTLDEVKTGENYAILISTNGGLWRYMIGDTIEFTSTHPYLFRITGRTKHFINAFGEELIIDNAEKALAEACKATNAQITEYTAAPVYFGDDNTGAHEWLIEFATEPDSLPQFIQSLDENLKKVNSDYEAKRSYNLSLGEPIVHSLPKGTFNEWLKSIGKLGGQNKVPRLSNNRDYVERLQEFVKSK